MCCEQRLDWKKLPLWGKTKTVQWFHQFLHWNGFYWLARLSIRRGGTYMTWECVCLMMSRQLLICLQQQAEKNEGMIEIEQRLKNKIDWVVENRRNETDNERVIERESMTERCKGKRGSALTACFQPFYFRRDVISYIKNTSSVSVQALSSQSAL